MTNEPGGVDRAEFEEFKNNLKTYLGHTDELVEELTKAFNTLGSKYDELLNAIRLTSDNMQILNTKIDLIAESKNLFKRVVQ